ncbi:MAG: phage portal protein [Pseudomonadota bacterium]
MRSRAATFMTGGVPRTIVTGGKETPLNNDDRDRLETAWLQKYSSIQNQAKPFFSKAPLDVKQLAPNFKDMDLSNIRAYERDIMISVFGIPPELVGVLQNSNRATIESAEFLFTKHVVLPRANAQRSAINDQLAPQFDPSLMIDFESPVDEDMEFRRTVMKDNAGSFMIDEHREMAGLEPLPEEAGRVLPQSFTTLLVRPEELGTPPDVLAGTAPVAEDFDEVERAVIAKMVTKNSDDNIENALNAIGDEDPMITDVLARAAGEAAEDFAKAQLGQLSVEVSFDVRDPRVEAIIRERAAESSKLINGTTRSELQQSLADGFAKGESTDQLVARIREVVRDAGVRRAKMISRTEITRASNFGTNEALDLAGVQEREWLATFDDNVRDRHAELDKQRRGSGQPFEIDGYSAMYPGDFGVGHMDINCRCGLIPVFEIEEIRRPTVWKAYDARRAPHERRLAINLDAAFKAQYGRVLAAFL